jgi:hypothetical protein
MQPSHRVAIALLLFVALSLPSVAQVPAGILQSDDHLVALTPDTPTPNGVRIPDRAKRHYQAARTAALNHQPDVFQRECDQALAAAPDLPEAFLLRATQEIATARYQQALWNIAAAQRLNPHLAFASTILASTFNDMRLYEDAFLALRDLSLGEAQSWQAIYERARAEVGMHNAGGAEQWSRRLLEAAPAAFPVAHLVRAEALALSARLELEQASISKELAP